ncbi:hypothetical protein EVJ58_g7686 [Rhodofomes roseus]|uniref:Uncharacterized protein n=1 Tax=Rhodofomes roseus TaxID=34475 RepID=A0A4Y9Y1N2_9APHY|nr:hypothetical protein EVJ58_g7686 [Rhodofomes roseus]
MNAKYSIINDHRERQEVKHVREKPPGLVIASNQLDAVGIS